MAIVKLGALVTTAVGKLGGHIFERHPQGNYVRTNYFRSSSRNYIPPSARQSFDIARNRYRDLDPETIQQWGELAQRFPVPDWDGDNQYLTARQFHGKTTVQALSVGIVEPIDPATYSNFIAPWYIVATQWYVNLEFMNIGFAPLDIPRRWVVDHAASIDPVLNPSSLSYSMAAFFPDPENPGNHWDEIFSALYPDVNPVSNIYIRAYSVSPSGARSLPVYSKVDIIF